MSERDCDSAVVADEMPVKVCKPRELLELFPCCRCRPLLDSSDLGWVRLKLPLSYHDAQKADLSRVKRTFLRFHVQFVIQE